MIPTALRERRRMTGRDHWHPPDDPCGYCRSEMEGGPHRVFGVWEPRALGEQSPAGHVQASDVAGGITQRPQVVGRPLLQAPFEVTRQGLVDDALVVAAGHSRCPPDRRS